MLKILQKNDALLRMVAKSVPPEEIKTQKIQKIIADMKTAMHREKDAVGIAAPQIGVPLRIFIVSGIIFAPPKKEGAEQEEREKSLPPDLVCINGEITKRSKKITTLEEGCLSVRWFYGDVSRAEKVTLRAYDEEGKKFTRGASGLLSQIFQHEVDHLNGILFIDKAKNMREVLPKSDGGKEI